MLFDPQWDALSREGLIAWLEKQPADQEYEYVGPCSCLLAQYLASRGYQGVHVDSKSVIYERPDGHEEMRALPAVLDDIARDYPRTFGAALERALLEDAG